MRNLAFRVSINSFIDRVRSVLSLVGFPSVLRLALPQPLTGQVDDALLHAKLVAFGIPHHDPEGPALLHRPDEHRSLAHQTISGVLDE